MRNAQRVGEGGVSNVRQSEIGWEGNRVEGRADRRFQGGQGFFRDFPDNGIFKAIRHSSTISFRAL